MLIAISFTAFGQTTLVDVKTKTFKTSSKVKIQGDIGYMVVPENRKNPSSRKIKVKYVHLKSLSAKPSTPVVYLEGGGGYTTWQLDSPKDLNDWLEILEIADLIFIDRRGSQDESLNYIWQEAYPENFFVSEEQASLHYQTMAKVALKTFEENNIDIQGYNIEAHAQDVDDLMKALGIDTYSIIGFSYGSHIGMTIMKLYPEKIQRAILVGSDAPNQALNYPRYLDIYVDKLGKRIQQDPELSKAIPDFRALLEQVMMKLDEKPAMVTIKNPLTRQDMDLAIGSFGLSVILRLDIDDYNDISVIPRLIYSINQGDYSMLTWFAQRRMEFGLVFPGGGINQQLASGASDARWTKIKAEAKKSIFGNVVNFPFSAVKESWPTDALSFDPSIPLKTDIPSLFITGTLDCRTPIAQVEETMKGFTNAYHIEVEYAGHEQAMWEGKTANEIIPAFLLGKEVQSERTYYGKGIKFLPLEGETDGHPSVR